jgi:hypothetical protein
MISNQDIEPSNVIKITNGQTFIYIFQDYINKININDFIIKYMNLNNNEEILININDIDDILNYHLYGIIDDKYIDEIKQIFTSSIIKHNNLFDYFYLKNNIIKNINNIQVFLYELHDLNNLIIILDKLEIEINNYKTILLNIKNDQINNINKKIDDINEIKEYIINNYMFFTNKYTHFEILLNIRIEIYKKIKDLKNTILLLNNIDLYLIKQIIDKKVLKSKIISNFGLLIYFDITD